MAADPHLLYDRAPSNPNVVAAAARRLADWKDETTSDTPGGVDPHDVVLAEGGPFHVWGELPAYLERLRATGRKPIADQLAVRHPEAAARRGPE